MDEIDKKGHFQNNFYQGKLSGRPGDSDFIIIGTSLFAYVTGESAIRMIDLASSDNLLLRISPEMGFANNEVLVSIAYSPLKGITFAFGFII